MGPDNLGGGYGGGSGGQGGPLADEQYDDGSGNGFGGYSPPGGSGSSNPTVIPTIIKSTLPPCLQAILSSLQTTNGSDVGGVFALLGNSTSVTWTIKADVIPPLPNRTQPPNAITETTGTTPSEVTTTLQSSYVLQATDVAVARTLIHESLHAYLGRWGRLNNMPTNSTLGELLDGYMKGTGFSGADQHALMSGIVSQMATALQGYCNSKGIVLFHERAENLFWSGLTETPNYALLSAERRDMISRENSAEQQNIIVPSSVPNGIGIIPQGRKACN